MGMTYAHIYHTIPEGFTVPRSAPSNTASSRRATNVTLPEPLLRDARALGINLSQACERGLSAAVAEHRRALWLEQNRDAINAWNEHVAAHGLPLAGYRQF